METDLAAQVQTLNDSVLSAVTAFNDDRAETERQNVLRDRRILWSRIATVVALVVGLGGVGVAIWALTVGSDARATTEDIIEARTAGRAATCSIAEAFANALISLPRDEPRTTEEQARLERIVRFFEADLERRTEALGCDITIELPAG